MAIYIPVYTVQNYSATPWDEMARKKKTTLKKSINDENASGCTSGRKKNFTGTLCTMITIYCPNKQEQKQQQKSIALT